MSVSLPAWCIPHEVTIRALQVGGGMGDTYAAPFTTPAWVVDDRKMVRDDSGDEVTSSTSVTVDFDVVVPLGSLVTVWTGTPRERESEVLSIESGSHPNLPAYQTLSLA